MPILERRSLKHQEVKRLAMWLVHNPGGPGAQRPAGLLSLQCLWALCCEHPPFSPAKLRSENLLAIITGKTGVECYLYTCRGNIMTCLLMHSYKVFEGALCITEDLPYLSMPDLSEHLYFLFGKFLLYTYVYFKYSKTVF